MRDDNSLRVLVETLQRQGATEQEIVRAVRQATEEDRITRAARPARRALRTAGRRTLRRSRS